MKSNRGWATVEVEEDGELFIHVVPVIKYHGAKTREEGEIFLNKCLALGSPVLTDDDDIVTHTYFGHTLSCDCVCGPDRQSGLLVHHLAN